MIESLFKDLPTIQRDENENSELTGELSYSTDSDDSLLASLPVVQKIVRRKGLIGWQSDAADLVQGVALRLLNWRGKNPEKSKEMSSEEWQSFAARTAFNEINRQNSNKLSQREISLEDVPEAILEQSFEGQTSAEFLSLSRAVWQEVCSLTLRQRRALLLHNQKMLINLMQSGITDEELAQSLEMTLDEWLELQEKIPLRNREIAEFIIEQKGSGKSLETLVKSIKKARHEARAKVRRVTDK